MKGFAGLLYKQARSKEKAMDKAVVWVAMFSSFGLGMCFVLLGSISVKLMPRLKIDEGRFGSLISIFMFTCLVASLIVGVSIDKIGYQPVAIFGFVLTSVCIFMFANSKTFSSVALSCILLGFGAMALNVTANTLLPIVLFDGKNPAAASNLGNTFFGLGLFLTPLVISFLLKKATYEKAVSGLAVIVLLPVLFTFFATYPEVSSGFSLKSAVGLLAEPAVLVAATALFCFTSLQTSFCNWLAPFGKEVITAQGGADEGTVDASAQRLLSLFAIGIMVGRLIASQIDIITEYGSWFIAGGGAISALIIILMMRTKKISHSRILAVLAGLAFAPLFPTIVGVTFSKFNPEIYGSIFGIIFAVGLLGAVIISKAIGNFAKGASVQEGLKLLLPACILLVILAIVLGQIKGRV
jgi:fucose permease